MDHGQPEAAHYPAGRIVLEAAVLVLLVVVLAPKVVAIAEIAAGPLLMSLGLLWLLGWVLWPRRHPFAGGLVVGGLLGWRLGRR